MIHRVTSLKPQLVKSIPLKTLFSCFCSITSGPPELTLAILKPDLVANSVDLEEVKDLIFYKDFDILQEKRLRLSTFEAENFYKEHHGKFFYNRLVTYMSSGPIEVCILSRFEGIKTWRALMGPTKVLRAIYEDPDSIRGRFGLTDTRNATHGSDSVDNARKEIQFFFPEFDVEKWEQSHSFVIVPMRDSA